MLSSIRNAVALAALCAAMASGCTTDPQPDGGTGGGTGGGSVTGGGSGGGDTGGGGGETGGGTGSVQFTEYVRDLVVTGTNDTSAARPSSEYENLADDAPIAYSPEFFDGGAN